MTSIQDLFASALQHFRAGDFSQAEALCLQIVRADPRQGAVWNLLGTIAYQGGNYDAALTYFERAQYAAPASAAYRSNRGAVLQGLGRRTEAEAEFREALRLNPNYPEAYNNLGDVLRDLQRHDEAEACCRRALELRPDYADAFNNLGNVHQDLGRFAEAEQCFRRVVEANPTSPEAHFNLGAVCVALHQFDDAERLYRRALELRPGYAAARNNLAHLLLMTGDFANGWVEFESRWQVQRGSDLPSYPQPLWDGSALAGRTILVHAEQGIGDTLLFVRFLSLVQHRGGRVLFHCPKPLVELVRTCPGCDEVIPSGVVTVPFDVHIPLLSLPRLLGTTLDTIPVAIPYLSAEPALVETWRQRLADVTDYRVGIVWRGSPRYPNDRRRSVDASWFEPLKHIAGVHLFSMQVGPGCEQLMALPGVTDLGSRFDPLSFRDAAAVLMSLDLVISVDTALVHLAGAMGRPVWVALPFGADWRWFLKREDSPWYPTARLFRQTQPGEWNDVFERIRFALANRS